MTFNWIEPLGAVGKQGAIDKIYFRFSSSPTYSSLHVYRFNLWVFSFFVRLSVRILVLFHSVNALTFTPLSFHVSARFNSNNFHFCLLCSASDSNRPHALLSNMLKSVRYKFIGFGNTNESDSYVYLWFFWHNLLLFRQLHCAPYLIFDNWPNRT